MPEFFDPTPQARARLDKVVADIPGIQQTLVAKDPQLTRPDRGAHQQQIAGSKVLLEIAETLPDALVGLGIFRRDAAAAANRVGIGRLSTGLGCPHAQTDPDFLGLMVAFLGPNGRRYDFITINDPTSPTRTPEEFIALLKATADSAGSSGLLASQTKLLLGLAHHAGVRAPAIATHVLGQTLRTARSTTAYQQYWTGIVRARDVLGKFTFVPASDHGAAAVERSNDYFSQEWKARQSAGPLVFTLRWIPFLSEDKTPLTDLTAPWAQDHSVAVGTVTFPRIDPDATVAKLTALLASEMGANPGHWDEMPDGPRADLPATEFTAARALVYRKSQDGRGALPEEAYASFFSSGEIGPALAAELIRRYNEKRAAGHNVPSIGPLPAV